MPGGRKGLVDDDGSPYDPEDWREVDRQLGHGGASATGKTFETPPKSVPRIKEVDPDARTMMDNKTSIEGKDPDQYFKEQGIGRYMDKANAQVVADEVLEGVGVGKLLRSVDKSSLKSVIPAPLIASLSAVEQGDLMTAVSEVADLAEGATVEATEYFIRSQHPVLSRVYDQLPDASKNAFWNVLGAGAAAAGVAGTAAGLATFGGLPAVAGGTGALGYGAYRRITADPTLKVLDTMAKNQAAGEGPIGPGVFPEGGELWNTLTKDWGNVGAPVHLAYDATTSWRMLF
jgi:hypothetical protein